jgi:hypothetical protein
LTGLILLPPFASRQARETGGSLVFRDLSPVEASFNEPAEQVEA